LDDNDRCVLQLAIEKLESEIKLKDQQLKYEKEKLESEIKLKDQQFKSEKEKLESEIN
jgi:hypothetical protein